MNKHSKLIVVTMFIMIFATWFSHNVKSDLPLIFQKDLRAHDESSNSTVAANITRQFFPPMIRVNPLDDKQGNWMEGPFWQHIPPLFAYVPYAFFELDGHVSIEVKRLSYAFVTLLTGILFIAIVFWFSRNLLAAFAALLASLFWINTPFTHELITGYAFGVSDIVLAFTAVLAFGGILFYLEKDRAERLNYSWKRLAVIALLVALPVMAKNLLGALPAAGFVLLLFWDQKKFNRNFWTSLSWLAGWLIAYYSPLLIASPGTFKNEILVSFFHAVNYEGWGRPWHFYITDYLPHRYLFGWTVWYWLGIIGALLTLGIRITNYELRITVEAKMLGLCLGWFAANLLAISLIISKIPNFIYQSYLFSLFAIFLSLFWWFDKWRIEQLDQKYLKWGLGIALVIALLVTGRSVWRFEVLFEAHRAAAYNYNSEREKFYQVGEWLQNFGLGPSDLVIARVSDNDCWLRYDVLF